MRIRARRWRRNGEPLDHGAAGKPTATPRGACGPRVKEHVTRLVVDVGNCASAWRDAATDAELAFARWRNAAQVDRGKAAAVYLAAIEREEKAASEYGRALEACSTTVP